MTTTTKKSTFQLLERLNWCSRTEFAIAAIVWVVVYGMALNEPDIQQQNFFVVMFGCFAWSIPIMIMQRWVKKIPKAITWLWTKLIQKLGIN